MALLIGDVNKGDWQALEEVIAAIKVWVGKQEGLNKTLETATGAIVGVPTGSQVAWPTATAPTGWLLCDGSLVSRTTYAKLFDVIGITFGSGDGSTTFALPDCRGRFILGKAASGTGSTLAGTGGALDHTHSIDPPVTTTSGPSAFGLAPATPDDDPYANSSHTHTVDIAAFTSATSNPPFIAQNWIIRT